MPRPLLAPALALCLLAHPAGAGEITVFAAASLKGPLDAAAEAWAQASGTGVVVSYGGSSALARQIEEGAPADLFLSAAESWMDRLEDDGLLRPGTRADLWGNALVLVAADPEAAPIDLAPGAELAAQLGQGRLAMALVDSVPAGQYGKEALLALGQWQSVEAHVVQAQDVKGALMLVTSGEAEFGIVYASDAKGAGAHVVARFPEASHSPIRYPGAVIEGSAMPEAAAAFLAYLGGAEAQAIFAEAGFAPLP